MPRHKINSYTLLKELLKSIPEDDSCMEWPRSKVHFGYGAVSIGDRRTSTHRAAYELTVGPIPEGVCVLHNCPAGDNPACFRPSHLWLGTRPDNIQDCINKNRRTYVRGELQGNAKLSTLDIKDIRRLVKAGVKTERSCGPL